MPDNDKVKDRNNKQQSPHTISININHTHNLNEGTIPVSTGSHTMTRPSSVKWNPYNNIQAIRDLRKPKNRFICTLRGETPCFAEMCCCQLNCCTIFTLLLTAIGIMTILPPLILTTGPQINAKTTFIHTECFVINKTVLVVNKPCQTLDTTAPPAPSKRTKDDPIQCPDYIPTLQVYYNTHHSGLNVPPNVTTWAYRRITDSSAGGGWKISKPANNYIEDYDIQESYDCWYDKSNLQTVVMDVDLDSLFWLGFGVILAVVVFCIILPCVGWSVITGKRYAYPDRLQLLAQKTIYRCKCCYAPPLKLSNESTSADDIEAQSDIEVVASISSNGIELEEMKRDGENDQSSVSSIISPVSLNSIDLPFPQFNNEKLHTT